jgi:NADH-quinone oxidoreductase subunit D
MPDVEARQIIEVGYGGNERLLMNMGPQHPSSHGVFRAILVLEGETVVAVDAVIGYLHRCHEKLAENLTYVQYPSIASKTDYVSAMTAELAYVHAVEKVGKIEVPKRAQYLRVLAAELQRIASYSPMRRSMKSTVSRHFATHAGGRS